MPARVYNRLIDAFSSGAVSTAFKVAYLALAFMSFNSFFANLPVLTYAAYALVLFGSLVIVARLCRIDRYASAPLMPLLLLFLASYVISAVSALKYGFMDNVQGFIWVALQFFCLYATDASLSRESLLKDLLVFAKVFVGYTAVATTVGLLMGFVGYHDGFSIDSMAKNVIGIVQGRLYGLYSDPNYGAVIALTSITFGWWIFSQTRGRASMAFALYNTPVQLLYIGLTGSRTGVLATLFVGFILAFLLVARALRVSRFSMGPVLRYALSCLMSLCFALGLLGCFKGSEVAYPTFSPIVERHISFPIDSNYFNERIRITNSSDGDLRLEFVAPAPEIEAEGESVQLPDNTADVSEQEAKEPVGLSARVNAETGDYSTGRFSIWHDAVSVFMSSPIWGASHRHISDYASEVFPDCYIVAEGFTTMHNVFFDILASQGLLGFVPIMVFVVAGIATICKGLLRQNGKDYVGDVLLTTVLAGIAFSALFYSEVLYINTVGSVVFWTVLGHQLTRYKQEGIVVFDKMSTGGNL